MKTYVAALNFKLLKAHLTYSVQKYL